MAKIVILFTKTPYGKSEFLEAMNLALECLKIGDTISIYLLSDAVLCAKQGLQGEVGERMKEAINLGADVCASREELLARGINDSGIIAGVKLSGDLLRVLVEDVMEHADSVISL